MPVPVANVRAWRTPHWALTGVIGIALGAGAVLGVQFVASGSETSAASGAGTPEGEPTAVVDSRFKDAMDACMLWGNAGIEIVDAERTITVDNKGNDDYEGAATTDVFCVLDSLKASAAVQKHIQQTTSMDGRQTETWDGITFSWSYHPDRGLDGVLTLD